MIVTRTARNLTDHLARCVAQLHESEQDDVIEALQGISRRRGWIDHEQHEYGVELDGQEFARLSMKELLA